MSYRPVKVGDVIYEPRLDPQRDDKPGCPSFREVKLHMAFQEDVDKFNKAHPNFSGIYVREDDEN